MSDKILLSILTPDRRVCETEVDEVVLPGAEGYLGVLPGHAPLLTSLKIGEISFRQGSRWQFAFLAWGFAEVARDRVSVLADISELAGEIDLDRAEAARQRAEDRLTRLSPETDHVRARAALERATARLMVAGHK